MKKQLTAGLLIFAILLTMTGCTVANAARKLDAAEEVVEAKLDAAEEKLEEALIPAPTTNPEVAGELTQEQAQQIALDYLGIALEDAQRLRIQYEMDDGIPQYDVEFYQGDWEYEFEIHAKTGKILSLDKDSRYD
jgi:uncharacterized membrane protein YkoI